MRRVCFTCGYASGLLTAYVAGWLIVYRLVTGAVHEPRART